MCGILVYQDRMSSATKYESSVMLLTGSNFQLIQSFVSHMIDGLPLLAAGNDNQIHIFCLCGNRLNKCQFFLDYYVYKLLAVNEKPMFLPFQIGESFLIIFAQHLCSF